MGQLVAIVAKPAGYGDRDKPRVEFKLHARIDQMSDAELLTRIEEWFLRMGLEPPDADVLLRGGVGNEVAPFTESYRTLRELG